jgi:sugar O-acyltransferase (sialic acid O-acetyltransferase NeuD family)
MPMDEPNSSNSLVLLGAGDHARVVLDAALQHSDITVRGLLDPDPALHGTAVLGCPVLGGDEKLMELAASGTDGFIVAVGSIGDASIRRQLFQNAIEAGLHPASVVHLSAVISPHAAIGHGVAVLAGVVVNVHASVGDNAILNTRCVLEHDVHVGAHTHIAPGAVVCGNVTIGEGCHIGAGAVIRQNLRIGDEAVIGAGSAVVRNVNDGETVLGVPGRARIDR